MFDDAEVGRSIQRFRKEKGLTQKELAEKLGKSLSSIKKYEKGLITIPNDVLAQIADVLGLKFGTYALIAGTSDYDLMGAFEDYMKTLGYEIHGTVGIDTGEVELYDIYLSKVGRWVELNSSDYERFKGEIRSFVDFKMELMLKKQEQ